MRNWGSSRKDLNEKAVRQLADGFFMPSLIQLRKMTYMKK